nr:unnamed protein product [Callosobruchus analis]
MVGLQKSFEGLSLLVRESGDRKEKEAPIVNKVDHSYIYIWKELGGNQVVFGPGGKTHPQAFIKKLKKLFLEAGVPEDQKIGLAISCLRGTAADWAAIKENCLTSFEDFETAFINRYWGIDKQRDLYSNLCYGRYENGSRADYFLNLINQAGYLTESLPEAKLISMVSRHFPAEIQRGIAILGLKTFDEVEEYLRNIDEAGPEVRMSSGGNNIQRRQQNFGRERRDTERLDGGIGNVRNIMSHKIPVFCEDLDLVSSDAESDVGEEIKFQSPILRGKIGCVSMDIVVDSGSEVSAISENLFNKMKEHMRIPTLPVSGLAISPAFGAKRQRIRLQALLPIKLHCPGAQNRVADTLSRFPANKDIGLSPERSVDITIMVQKPQCLLSDNGTQFSSKKWSEALGEIGIQAKFISVYFPEGNITERYNREVGRLLRMYCHEKHSRWAYVLDFVEECLNTAISDSTGYSPRYLHSGETVEHPVTRFINFPVETTVKPSLQQLWMLAHDRMSKNAKRRAIKHSGKITPIEFREGDKVLVRTHMQSCAEDKTIKKFFYLYTGPYWILRKAGPNCYILRDGEGKELPKQNIINLKGYKDLPPGFPM